MSYLLPGPTIIILMALIGTGTSMYAIVWLTYSIILLLLLLLS